jgi:TolB protein
MVAGHGLTLVALLALFAPMLLPGVTAERTVAPAPDGWPAPRCADPPCHPLLSTIAFTSTRDDPLRVPPINAAEIYLADPDGGNARRLTANDDGDGLPALSPTGRQLIFDSNRLRVEGQDLTFDLFVMELDGGNVQHVAAGSSASWSPDGHVVVYHRSASGAGQPIRPDPGSPPSDSDIFIVNVDDAVDGGATPRNLTADAARIDDDPDWSPGGDRIVYTSQLVGDDPANPTTAEIFLIDPDGGTSDRLTNDDFEERSPDWSPAGDRIVYSCRIGAPTAVDPRPTFEICVMAADGTGVTRLTQNTQADLSPSWSPDGASIVFQRPVAGRLQLWTMRADGTGQAPITSSAGINLFPSWGAQMSVPGDGH